MNAIIARGTMHEVSKTAVRTRSGAIIATALAIALSCANTSASAQSGPVSAAYLTGVWKENQQCTGGEAMVFFPNNTMSSAGSVPVNYVVSGPAQIMMYGSGGSVPIETQVVNQNKMVITFQNDATVLYRCGFNTPTHNYPAPNNNMQLSPAYITGGWGYNGNCNNPEVFTNGGQFRTSQGAPGTWTVFGNTLRMLVNNNSIDFVVQVNGHGNMTLTQVNNGQISNYTRCF